MSVFSAIFDKQGQLQLFPIELIVKYSWQLSDACL